MVGIDQDSADLLGIADGLAPADNYIQSEADQDLLSNIKHRFERAHEYRLPYEREWELHRLYLKGEQALLRDRNTGEYVRLRYKDNKRLYSMNNVLRPTARSLLGKLTRMLATFSVVPATMDAAEIEGAKTAEAFLEFLTKKLSLDEKYLELNEALIWAGTGVAKVEWDPDGGRELAWCGECETVYDDIELEGEECPVCRAQVEEMQVTEQTAQVVQQLEMQAGNPEAMADGPTAAEPPPAIPRLELVSEGEVAVRVLDPRDVFIEPGAVHPDEIRWTIVRSAQPVAEVRKRFPDMAPFIKVTGPSTAGETGRLSYNTSDDAMAPEYLEEHTVLYEYHEKPSHKYPEGRIVFMTDELLLDEVPGHYKKFGRLPFFFFRWTLNPGEFWGESFIAQAWHRQKELNSLETQIREHVELLTRVRALVPIGSRIGVDEISATSGQLIKYNAAAGGVEWLRPPPMPSEVFARRNELAGDIRSQAAITLQEAGMSPSDPNGRAMAIIEAEADQQVGPIMTRNLREWRKLHVAMLILAKEMYSPDRQFTVGGEDHFGQVYAMQDMNLKAGFDLDLEVEDGLSKNPAVRLTQVMDLWNGGMVVDPITGQPDIMTAWRLAKLKMPGIGPDLRGTEYAAAYMTLKRLLDGEPISPTPEDDPMVFSEVFLGWLRGRGRQEEDLVLRETVRNAWMFYQSWASSGAPDVGLLGGEPSGQGAPDQSAPGGTANNPGHLGTDLASDAGTQVGQADATAENAARVQPKHEG